MSKVTRFLPTELLHEKTSLRGGLYDYTDDRLGIPEWDEDQAVTPIEEISFGKRASMRDGTGGQKSIDTRYENYSEAEVNEPRSCINDHENPAAVSIDRLHYPHRRL